jgi:hypothetical protein
MLPWPAASFEQVTVVVATRSTQNGGQCCFHRGCFFVVVFRQHPKKVALTAAIVPTIHVSTAVNIA